MIKYFSNNSLLFSYILLNSFIKLLHSTYKLNLFSISFCNIKLINGNSESISFISYISFNPFLKFLNFSSNF